MLSRRRLLATGTALALAAPASASLRLHGSAATSAPASITNPIVGTSLLAVWNLQTSGTGARSSSNGTWSGALDAYLTGLGFISANGGIWLNTGTGAKALSNYDFTGAPPVRIGGTGTCSVTDCTFAQVASVADQGLVFPTDGNGNISSTGSALAVTISHCTFDGDEWFIGCGTMLMDHCRIKNQKGSIGGTSFHATGACSVTIDSCFISGGGVAPATNAHVELVQSIPNVSTVGCIFNLTNNMVNISLDGQTTTAPWGSAWTGMWSVSNCTCDVSNNIFIGVTEVNANPANPNVVNTTWVYDFTVVATLTNNVMEMGRFAYTTNGTGGAVRPTDGGGNRTFTNSALTAANFN